MSKIKILIVEDEAITAEYLANNLMKAGYEITGCFDNGEAALVSANSNPPDLVFLDISILGAYDGIETAKKLKSIGDFPVIFLTNITDNKIIQRAKAVNPANYLIKPFVINQLYISIQMALYNLSHQNEAQMHAQPAEDPDMHLVVLKDKFFIKQHTGAFYKHNISDILFMKAERSYCRIFLANGEELLQAMNMKDAQAKIRHPHFLKASRSFVINIDKIDAIKGNIMVIQGHHISVSREYLDHILNSLNILR